MSTSSTEAPSAAPKSSAFPRLDLPLIYINGGRRGLLLKISTEDLVRVLRPQMIEAALSD